MKNEDDTSKETPKPTMAQNFKNAFGLALFMVMTVLLIGALAVFVIGVMRTANQL